MSKAQAAEFKAKGNAALAASNFEEAVEHYTNAIKLDPTDHVFFSNRSAAYLSKGDAAAALADASECVRVKPDWSKGYGRKGAALHSLGRFDEAVAVYNEGLSVEPTSAALATALDEVRTAKREAERPPAPQRSPMGGSGPFGPDMYAKLGAHPKFKTYLQDPSFMMMLKMLQTNPSSMSSAMSDPRLMEVLGYLLGIPLDSMGGGAGGGAQARPSPASAQEDDDDDDMPGLEAEEDVPGLSPMPGMPGYTPPSSAPTSGGRASVPARAAAAPPQAPPKPETEEEITARQRKADCARLKADATAAYRRRDFAEALRLYVQGQDANDDRTDISFLLNQAAVHFETGETDRCIQMCDEAVAAGREFHAPFPMIAKAFARAGNAHAKAGNFDAAIVSYESSLMESHTDDVHDKLKKIRVTKRKAEEAAYLDPVKAEEAKQRGNELFKAGNFIDAITEYSEAIKRKPSDAVYYCNRATARTKIMDVQGALEDCNAAIRINPLYAKAYARKGALEYLKKEYHKAMESYKKGIELEGESEECAEGLRKTVAMINSSQSEATDADRAERAMADPEIQAILRDPMVQTALQDLGRDPKYAAQVMADPHMSAKISKLIAAGVVRTK